MVFWFAHQRGRSVFQQGQYSPRGAAFISHWRRAVAGVAEDFRGQPQAKFWLAVADGAAGRGGVFCDWRARVLLAVLLDFVRLCDRDDRHGIFPWRQSNTSE